MIKNIILDLGGVILNIDYGLTIEAFKKLGATNFEAVYTQAKQIEIFDQYDTGKISSDEFRKKLKSLINLSEISDQEFDHAWNAMLLNLPKENLNLLEQLKKHYRLFLFSNANDIHYDAAVKIFQRDVNQDAIDHYFDKVYFSHLYGFRKPDKKSFQQILTENNLIKEETLFIDDSAQHIQGAQKAGITAVHLAKGIHFSEILKQLNLI